MAMTTPVTGEYLPTTTCYRCGTAALAGDLVLASGPSDPLRVRECRRCGSIVSIGGHGF
jgi:ribosomal protein L37E